MDIIYMFYYFIDDGWKLVTAVKRVQMVLKEKACLQIVFYLQAYSKQQVCIMQWSFVDWGGVK